MGDTITMEDGFCHKLGLFVLQFASSESMLFLFLSLLLGIGKDECNAITSGAKIDGCSNYIKRVYLARGADVPPDIADCLDQLANINKLRNDILHRGVSYEGIISSHVRAMPGKIEEYHVSNKMLDQATADLYKINVTLAVHHAPIQGSAAEIKTLRSALAAPWQYKQPSQAQNHRTSQNKNPKHKPQREPSQE